MNKELHQMLLDLMDDAATQFELMNQLTIPEKIRIEAQTDFNFCLQTFLKLPSQERLLELIKNITPGTPGYKHVCTQQYFKYLDFYNALERLIVLHFVTSQHLEGNDYLKEALGKISEDTKTQIKSAAVKISTQNSPRNEGTIIKNEVIKSPRANEEVKKSPRKRGNTHAIAPLSWFKSVVNPEPQEIKQSPKKEEGIAFIHN